MSVNDGVLDMASDMGKLAHHSEHKQPMGVVTVGRDKTVVDLLGMTERLYTHQV